MTPFFAHARRGVASHLFHIDKMLTMYMIISLLSLSDHSTMRPQKSTTNGIRPPIPYEHDREPAFGSCRHMQLTYTRTWNFTPKEGLRLTEDAQ
jgi:hypothetical protein